MLLMCLRAHQLISKLFTDFESHCDIDGYRTSIWIGRMSEFMKECNTSVQP